MFVEFRLTNTGSSYASISGAATSIIQNFQIQNMLKESQAQGMISSTLNLDSSKKLNEAEICRICSILCTAEYCLDTTQQVIILRGKRESQKRCGFHLFFAISTSINFSLMK